MPKVAQLLLQNCWAQKEYRNEDSESSDNVMGSNSVIYFHSQRPHNLAKTGGKLCSVGQWLCEVQWKKNRSVAHQRRLFMRTREQCLKKKKV